MRKRGTLESQEPFGGRSLPEQIAAYDPAFQPDINQNQQFRKEIQIGSVPSDSRVSSVYDARPINAEDFVVESYFFEGGYASPQSITFAVPQGLVAVMRWFTIDTFASIVDIRGDSTTDFSVSLLVDNVVGKSYDAINPFGGVPSVERFPCYLLAPAGSTLELRINNTLNMAGNLYMSFYGQLLVATSRPLTHEPGVSSPEPVYVVGNPNPPRNP